MISPRTTSSPVVRLTVIGINYSPEATGIAPYTAGAAVGLAQHGHRVSVLTGYPHYPQWELPAGYSGWKRQEVIDGLSVLRLRHPIPHGSVAGRTFMEVIFGLRAVAARWHKPDVVLAVTPALLSTALVVAKARLQRRRVVVWVQDIYSLSATQTGLAARISPLVGAVESWTVRHASRVVVIHDRFAHFLTHNLGVDPSRIDVVRNWTHLTHDGVTRSAEVRAGHGWDPEETIVLHAGNMGTKQNLENVVRASQLAAENHSKVRFVLLGDGHRRQALEALGPNSHLQFIDPLPDAEFAQTLASADVLLVNELPGMTEMSVPSKLTSYFHSGLPVLAAVDSASVTADEIASAHAGLRVDADDPAALLAAAESLAADPSTAAKFGENGRHYRDSVLAAATSIQRLDAAITAASGS